MLFLPAWAQPFDTASIHFALDALGSCAATPMTRPARAKPAKKAAAARVRAAEAAVASAEAARLGRRGIS